jgi:hypothetical protein
VSSVTSGSSRSLNIAGIALIFIAIGPLVGGVFYSALGTVVLFLQNLSAAKGSLEIILAAPLFFLVILVSILTAPYSYLYGAVLAAGAGLAIGVLRLKYGRLNVPIVLAVGAVVGTIYCLALPRLPSAEFPKFVTQSGLGAGEYVLLGVTCVLATLTCWRFVRSFPLPGEMMSTSPDIVTPEYRADEDATDSTTISPVRKVAGIVGTFMVVGPPAGCFFVIVAGVTVGNILRGAPISEVLLGIPLLVLGAIAGMPYSYVYGIVPAAIAGLLIELLQLKFGGLNWPLVLAIGICVGVAYSLALGHLPSAIAGKFLLPSKLGTPEYVMHSLACVFATFVCWRFVRNWYPAKAE